MNTVLLTAGVVALMAAVIGGGLKAFNIEMPVLTSSSVRAALGILGIAFLAGAVLLPTDDTQGGDSGEARYQRQVLATCNAVRRETTRNKLGAPSGFDLRFDRSRVISSFRRSFATIDRRLDLLFDRSVPESLRDEAKIARRWADRYVRESRAALKEFADVLPPNPTLEQIDAAAASVGDRGDEIVAQLEDAMTELAGRECILASA
jgi:hypothetical protein